MYTGPYMIRAIFTARSHDTRTQELKNIGCAGVLDDCYLPVL